MRGLKSQREQPRGFFASALFALVLVALLLASGGLEVEGHEDPPGTAAGHKQHAAAAYRFALLGQGLEQIAIVLIVGATGDAD